MHLCAQRQNIKTEYLNVTVKLIDLKLGENIHEKLTAVLLTNTQNIKSFERYSYFETNEPRNTMNLKVTNNK